MQSKHQPVLLKEVLEYLQPKANQNFIDGTLGGGGHAISILKDILPCGKLLAIDLDGSVLETFQLKVKSEKLKIDNVVFARGNFRNLLAIIKEHNFKDISGILLDLGVSSMQLDEPEKGFGFEAEKLDMRMDASQDLTAEKIINSWSVAELIKIFRDYGEERLATPIAKAIEAERKYKRIVKPNQLTEVINSVYQLFYRKPSRKNPATKIFLALRIAVNDELKNLEAVMPQATEVLRPGGRLAIISFHSLEDRLVKNYFKLESKDCVCPPEFPVCQCNHKKKLKIITKKPITPTETETKTNPRSRSAKMRVAEKL